MFIMSTNHQHENIPKVGFMLVMPLFHSPSHLIISSHSLATHSLKCPKYENYQTLMMHFLKLMAHTNEPSKPMGLCDTPLQKPLSNFEYTIPFSSGETFFAATKSITYIQ